MAKHNKILRYAQDDRHSAFFIGPHTREAVQSGWADYVPVFLSDVPRLMTSGALRIDVPLLKPGAGVVTSRGDVHYVATEYGVASLHGKSIRERAEALIAIAHPKFRDELNAAAAEQNYMQERDMAELARP